jgi:hypothetical protein
MQRRRGVCGFDDLEADEFTKEEELVGLMICRQADKFGEEEELMGLMICS